MGQDRGTAMSDANHGHSLIQLATANLRAPTYSHWIESLCHKAPTLFLRCEKRFASFVWATPVT